MVTDTTANPDPNQNATSTEDDELGGAMTFLEHLQELRTRLIYAAIALFVCTCICLTFSNFLLDVLLDSVPEEVDVRFGSPVDGFIAHIKVALVAGIFFAFPFIFYQAWAFIAPGLYRKEKKFLLPLCFCSWSAFIIGAVFCHQVVFAFTLDFLAEWTLDEVTILWDVSAYLNFMLRFLLAFGIVFQEPIIILLLAKMGIVGSQTLSSFRPYAYVTAFVLAALITPPDPTSQIMCGIPLVILYEISILLVKMIEKKRADEEGEPT